jgi:LDH2 family malate/lactate/ureidoglycolate dehydrogenase
VAEQTPVIDIDWDRLASLCSTAIAAAGGNEDTAAALTDAVVSAERRGKTAVGVPHLSTTSTRAHRGRRSRPC